jgi:hypothetical protein
LRIATELVSSSAEVKGAGRLYRHEAATAAEGATMSDAFGVASWWTSVANRSDVAAEPSRTGTNMKGREPQC